MWQKLKKYIGHRYVFRLDGMVMSGFFCGIGKIGENYGMIFLSPKYENKSDDEISMVSGILVHPLRIKCILKSDILNLRRTCRKIFKMYKLKNQSEDIYQSLFEIEEVENEKRSNTRKR